MAEYPSLPLFTDAFIADTTHLNASQTGAYLMLLMTAWRSKDCRLPDDDRFLARAARMDPRAWKANKDAIMSFWYQDEQHKWCQRRLLDERKHVDDTRRKNAAAGKASALKRKERHSTDVQPNDNQNPAPTPTPTPTVNNNIIHGADFSEFRLPEWVPKEPWEAYLQRRLKLREADNSPITLSRLVATLQSLMMQGCDPAEVLDQSTIRGWKMLKKVDDDYYKGANKHGNYTNPRNDAAFKGVKQSNGAIGSASVHQGSNDAAEFRRSVTADAVKRREAARAST